MEVNNELFFISSFSLQLRKPCQNEENILYLTCMVSFRWTASLFPFDFQSLVTAGSVALPHGHESIVVSQTSGVVEFFALARLFVVKVPGEVSTTRTLSLSFFTQGNIVCCTLTGPVFEKSTL